MRVKIKRLKPGIILPTKATNGSAGYDLYSPRNIITSYLNKVEMGFALEIPEGYAGFIYPRSGNSIELKNTVGVIDSDYRGEVKLVLANQLVDYVKGDRIAQLIIAPVLNFEWEEVHELSETTRGTGGFGSTGQN